MNEHEGTTYPDKMTGKRMGLHIRQGGRIFRTLQLLPLWIAWTFFRHGFSSFGRIIRIISYKRGVVGNIGLLETFLPGWTYDTMGMELDG